MKEEPRITKPPSEDGLKHVLSSLDDYRRRVAALRTQRWEIFKWAVSINIAVAGAAAAIRELPWVFLFATVLLSAVALLLLYFTNRHLDDCRYIGHKFHSYLDATVFDTSEVVGLGPIVPSSSKDEREELNLLYFAMALSTLPSLAIFSVYAFG